MLTNRFRLSVFFFLRAKVLYIAFDFDVCFIKQRNLSSLALEQSSSRFLLLKFYLKSSETKIALTARLSRGLVRSPITSCCKIDSFLLKMVSPHYQFFTPTLIVEFNFARLRKNNKERSSSFQLVTPYSLGEQKPKINEP